jgi:hypothetical protein
MSRDELGGIDETQRTIREIIERGPDLAAMYSHEVAQGLNPVRYDFRWNEDFSAAQIIRRRWWDETSYIAYQGDPLPSEDN